MSGRRKIQPHFISRVNAIILATLILASCAGNHEAVKVKAKTRTGAPLWVLTPPNNEQILCAVGSVGPTLYRSDAEKNADEAARTELARTLQVEISSIMVDISSSAGSSVSESTISEISAWATSTVVEGAYIRDRWYDDKGLAGKSGFTYALTCMKRNLSRFKK